MCYQRCRLHPWQHVSDRTAVCGTLHPVYNLITTRKYRRINNSGGVVSRIYQSRSLAGNQVFYVVCGLWSLVRTADFLDSVPPDRVCTATTCIGQREGVCPPVVCCRRATACIVACIRHLHDLRQLPVMCGIFLAFLARRPLFPSSHSCAWGLPGGHFRSPGSWRHRAFI